MAQAALDVHAGTPGRRPRLVVEVFGLQPGVRRGRVEGAAAQRAEQIWAQGAQAQGRRSGAAQPAPLATWQRLAIRAVSEWYDERVEGPEYEPALQFLPIQLTLAATDGAA